MNVALATTWAGWKHAYLDTRRFTEVLMSFKTKGEAAQQLLVTQAIHSWHKAVEAAQQKRHSNQHKMEMLDQALQATFSYFEEAGNEAALASIFAGWKHAFLGTRRFAEVLMSFQTNTTQCIDVFLKAIHD